MECNFARKEDYKFIKGILKYLLFVLSFGDLTAQNVHINGRADPSYSGQVIGLYTSTDFLTALPQKESEDTVAADGSFEFNFQTEKTQPVSLKLPGASAELYVVPDFVYGITIPALDSQRVKNPDVELTLNIGIIGDDSTELNAMIFDYQQQYSNLFIKAADRFLSRASMFKRVDSLQKICDKRYASIRNPYFKSYVNYSIAGLNASLSRGEDYLMEKYIIGKPIQYGHKEYMTFFNACTKGYMNMLATRRKGQSLYNIINTRADYGGLLNFMRMEKQLRSDSLRELIILRSMWDFYFSADFVPEAVGRIVAALSDQTEIAVHRTIAQQMLAYFYKLQPGSPAPSFTAMAADRKAVSAALFKGKWIYINFFSTKNVESLKEMPKIATLKKKYGDKLVFLSICLDETEATYRSYLRSNAKFDWPIWYDGMRTNKAKQAYFITGTEGYFLINNSGYLAQSPALSPSKGIEYRLNAIFKIRQRNTKTGIR
jgi:hypothetical protein